MHGRYGVTMTRILAAIGLIWSTWLAAAPPMVDGDADGVSDEIDLCLYSRPGDVVNRVGCTLQDDSDADGVPDNVDFCLGTPTGRAVDPFGCETGLALGPVVAMDDGDGDGVSDREDVCPYTDAGAQVDPDGCALDRDFDGVADGLDRCPNSPLGQVVNAQGCPAPVTAPSVQRPAPPPPQARVPVAPPAQLPDPGVDVRGTAEQIASLATPAELAALGRELLRLSGAPQAPISVKQLVAPAAAPPPFLPAQLPRSTRPAPPPQVAAAPANGSPARQAMDSPPPDPPPPRPQPRPLMPSPAPVFAADDPVQRPEPVSAPVQTPAPAKPAPLPPPPAEAAVAPIPVAPVRVVSSRPAEHLGEGFAADVQFVRGSSELDGRIMSHLRDRKASWLAELQADSRTRLEVIGNQEGPPALAGLRAQIVRAYLMALGLPSWRIVVQSGATGGASVRIRLGATLEAR